MCVQSEQNEPILGFELFTVPRYTCTKDRLFSQILQDQRHVFLFIDTFNDVNYDYTVVQDFFCCQNLEPKFPKWAMLYLFLVFTWLSAISSVYGVFVCVTLFVAIMLGLHIVAHDMTQKVSIICTMNNQATLHRRKAKLQGQA